jgi:hypothetical protein
MVMTQPDSQVGARVLESGAFSSRVLVAKSVVQLLQ